MMRHKLRRMREARALSLLDVASRSGLTVNSVWALETGKTRIPRARTLRLLAECYGVAPDDVRAACVVPDEVAS